MIVLEKINKATFVALELAMDNAPLLQRIVLRLYIFTISISICQKQVASVKAFLRIF